MRKVYVNRADAGRPAFEKSECKCRSLADAAFYADLAAVCFDQLFYKRQSETGAARILAPILGPILVKPGKPAEDHWELFLGYPFAGVAYADVHTLATLFCVDCHSSPAICVSDGI